MIDRRLASLFACAVACACTAPTGPEPGDRSTLENSSGRRCQPGGPTITRPVVALALDESARLLAVEQPAAELTVLETECWTPIASHVGVRPRFVGGLLEFQRPGSPSGFRWDPATDTLTPASVGPLINPDELCGFGPLTDASTYSVAWTGEQFVWTAERHPILHAHAPPGRFGCTATAASPNGLLAVADESGTVWVSERPRESASRLVALDRSGVSVSVLAWRGSTLYIGGRDREENVGVVWRWEPGDGRAELVSRYFAKVSSLAASEAWLAVGLDPIGDSGPTPTSLLELQPLP